MSLGRFEEHPTDKQVYAVDTTIPTRTIRTIKMAGTMTAGTSIKMATMATSATMGTMTMATTRAAMFMAAASAALKKIPRLSATSP